MSKTTFPRKLSKLLAVLTAVLALCGLIETLIITSFGRESASLALMEGKGLLFEFAHMLFCMDNQNLAPRLDSFIFWRLVIGYTILLLFSALAIIFIWKQSPPSTQAKPQ